jgi:hypothetical protein
VSLVGGEANKGVFGLALVDEGAGEHKCRYHIDIELGKPSRRAAPPPVSMV